MFGDYVYKVSSAEYTNRMILIDLDHIADSTDYTDAFVSHGFEIIRYENDLHFRIHYERIWKGNSGKISIISDGEKYIPYDIQACAKVFRFSKSDLFPRLNPLILKNKGAVDYDLISEAYQNDYEIRKTVNESIVFLETKVYEKNNVRAFLSDRVRNLIDTAQSSMSYREWFSISQKKALLDALAIEYDTLTDTSVINVLFRDYMMNQYGKLSSVLDRESPVLVCKAMEFMHEHSKRFVIIIMDGMSEFDWNILAKSFDGIHYEETAAFAMIPTVTSVSRQCLLSNKYPSQLIDPWSQSKEKQEFFDCARKMGFTAAQISYHRGYDADFGSLIRCGAVIINDIDDLVHGQKQGRIGMFNDVSVMAKQKKLVDMTRRFLSAGFDVYITADHGNTNRRGMGKLMSTGVETETKSRCMLVLKGFADKDSIKEKYSLLEFPKTYLPKEYDYLICDVGDSFDAKGEEVMSHSGISLEECVVPFIKIKAVENNG